MYKIQPQFWSTHNIEKLDFKRCPKKPTKFSLPPKNLAMWSISGAENEIERQRGRERGAYLFTALWVVG
jgi:hypothetical protein